MVLKRLFNKKCRKKFNGVLEPVMFFIFLFLCLTGCEIESGFTGFRADEYKRLLTGNSSKIWAKAEILENGTIAAADPCNDLTLLEFRYIDDNPSNRYFEVKKDPVLCDGDTSMVNEGNWNLATNSDEKLKSDAILFITGADTTWRWIKEITSLRLSLKSERDGIEIIENYQYRERL